MSLKYGLNVKKKAPTAPARRAIFDDGDDDDDDIVGGTEATATAIEEVGGPRRNRPPQSAPSHAGKPPKPKGPPTRGPPGRDAPDSRQDLSTIRAAQAQVQAAEAEDSSIFDYDSFHDAKTSLTEGKKAAARQDALERKPKYITNLLDAAARRKQDQQVAREKFLQHEREAEGDEFADKEKFVTGAYKQQQEETRRLEAEEAQRAAADEERRRRLGGGTGMSGFYRNMMDASERQHQEAMEATTLLEQRRENGEDPSPASPGSREQSDSALAASMRARGVNVHLNDDGQITDKRQLLSAGLNVGGPKGGRGDDERGGRGRGGADHLRTSANRHRASAFGDSKAGESEDRARSQRERQTRMLEEQLVGRAKRAREEEDEEREKREKAAKSTKTEQDVGDAKARYLARKAARERGETG